MRTPSRGWHWPSLDTIAIGQTAVVAVLLVTQFVPQPHISSGVADQGGLAYGVPLASFVVMAASLATGFGMLLIGASRSGARLRYGVLAAVTLLLAIQPVTSLISADAGREYSLVLVFSAAQLAILAVWWRWSARPVLVWVLLPVYYLLVAGVWLVFAAHGRAAALARVPLALAALLLAVVFILKGRGTHPHLAAGGLLLAMVALVILTITYPAALAGLGLRTLQPRDILGAVDVGAAAATLGWLGLLWYQGQWGTQGARLRRSWCCWSAWPASAGSTRCCTGAQGWARSSRCCSRGSSCCQRCGPTWYRSRGGGSPPGGSSPPGGTRRTSPGWDSCSTSWTTRTPMTGPAGDRNC
jgi:hypothetical protein